MSENLPPDLQHRIQALEDPAQQGSDFDAVSWVWLLLLGLAGPLALLVWGWAP